MTLDERAKKMLATALQMEEKGKAFYEKAMSSATNTLGKDIFKMLRDDEIIHVGRIKAIYSAVDEGGDWTGQWKKLDVSHETGLSQMFRDIAHRNGPDVQAAASDIEALDVGIEFESTAVKFYQKNLQAATDPVEKEFIEKMITEEKDHHTALVDMKSYLEDPDSWFMERERGGLDGA